MSQRVGVAAAVVTAAAVLSACGSEGGSGRSGADLTCPGARSRTFLDHEESDPGAQTAALAAEPFLDQSDRVVHDGGPETVTFRTYDTNGDLLRVVRVVQMAGQWYADRVDACE